jgi:hypothetical protein
VTGRGGARPSCPFTLHFLSGQRKRELDGRHNSGDPGDADPVVAPSP